MVVVVVDLGVKVFIFKKKPVGDTYEVQLHASKDTKSNIKQEVQIFTVHEKSSMC